MVDYKETDNVKVKEEINSENINDDKEVKSMLIAFIFLIIFIILYFLCLSIMNNTVKYKIISAFNNSTGLVERIDIISFKKVGNRCLFLKDVLINDFILINQNDTYSIYGIDYQCKNSKTNTIIALKDGVKVGNIVNNGFDFINDNGESFTNYDLINDKMIKFVVNPNTGQSYFEKISNLNNYCLLNNGEYHLASPLIMIKNSDTYIKDIKSYQYRYKCIDPKNNNIKITRTNN